MATLKNTTVNDTGFIRLPEGTTAQRPGSPTTGMVRYNTTMGCMETYNGSSWVQFRNIINDGLIWYADPSNLSTYSGSGTAINNLVGSGANATLTSAASFSTNNGGILNFTSSGAEAVGIGIPNFSTSGVSLCTWVNLDSLGAEISRFITMFQSTEIATIRKGLSGNHIEFYVVFPGTSFRYVNAFNFLQLGAWTYLVGTFDGNTLRVYQNGILRASSSNSGSLISSSTNVGLSQGATELLRGRMGHAAVYNRALTQPEIVQNFNSTRGRFGV